MRETARFVVANVGTVLILVSAATLTGCATLRQLLITYDPLNLHIVESGELVRSGQPRSGDLGRIVEEHGVRSVINLRGPRPDQGWYDIELAESEQLGLERVDIAMSVSRIPHRDDLIALLDAFRELPRPILLHCNAGADRTGEAVAIYMLEHMDRNLRQALGALHPRYGHIPDIYPAKTYFVEEVYQGEVWAREVYDPCEQEYLYYDREFFCASSGNG